MTFRNRIALIVGGVIIFIIIAPLAILLAQGYFIDFREYRIVKTGTLVIKTAPRGAKITIDGQKNRSSTPLTKRFLLPGEYQIEISKTDYKPWKKRIAIYPQRVTYLPQTLTDKIYLLAAALTPIILSTTTSDFLLGSSGIYSLNPGAIFHLDPEGKDPKIIFASTTLSFLDPKITDFHLDRFGKFEIIINSENETIFLTSDRRETLSSDYHALEIDAATGEIFALDKNLNLLKFNNQLQQLKILASNVQAFNSENGIYYLSGLLDSKLLQVTNESENRVILPNIPAFTKGQIIVSAGRQIFLFLDTNLYEVKEELEKINDHVEYVFWNEDLPGLIYGNRHELWIYFSQTQKNTLVTRTSQKLGQAVFNPKIGYAFVSEENQIKAIEFDSLGQANIYQIAQTKNPDPKLAVDPEGNYLIYLDGQELISLKIR